METNGTTEQWNLFSKKRIRVIFEDGDNHFSKKEGLFINCNSTHLIIQTEKKEAINLLKILRIEEIINGKN